MYHFIANYSNHNIKPQIVHKGVIIMIYVTQANPVLLSVFFILESMCIWRGERQQKKDDVDTTMHKLHKRCHVCAHSRQHVNFHPSKAVISPAVHLFLENNRVWK